MKRTLLLLYIVLVCVTHTYAQVYEGQVNYGFYKINSTIYDPLSLSGVPMKVHAGRSDYYETGGGGVNAAIFGNFYGGGTNETPAFWTTVPGFGGNYYYEFTKVIKGSNGDYYAVGWALDGNISTKRVGLICEFRPNTMLPVPPCVLVAGYTVNASNSIEGLADLTYTDLVEAKTEAGAKFIVATGWKNTAANGDEAVITEFNTVAGECVVSGPLSVVWSAEFSDPNSTARFNAITSNNGKIYAGGYNTVSSGITGNPFDAVITVTNVGCTPPSSINTFSYQYSASGVNKVNDPTTLINAFTFNKLIFDGVLGANGSLTDGFAPNAEDGSIVAINPANMAVGSAIQYGDPNTSLSNSVPDMANLISSVTGEFMMGLSPGPSVFDNYSFPIPPYPTVIMEIKTGSTIVLSKILDAGNTLRSASFNAGNIYCGGYTSNPVTPGTLYTGFTLNSNLAMGPTNCDIEDYPTQVNGITVTESSIIWPVKLNSVIEVATTAGTPDGLTSLVCGTPFAKSSNDTTLNAGIQLSNGETNSLVVSPNPVRGKCVAEYVINGTYKTAYIKVSDNLGKTLLNIPVTEKSGKIILNIPADAVSDNLYCFLVVDEKMVASQKIVLMR